MKVLLATLIASVSFVAPSAFAADAAMKADAAAIDTACSTDAATAGCGSEKVGTGLLRCLHAYKKAHKADFKFSDGCKAAMKTMHADRKAGK